MGCRISGTTATWLTDDAERNLHHLPILCQVAVYKSRLLAFVMYVSMVYQQQQSVKKASRQKVDSDLKPELVQAATVFSNMFDILPGILVDTVLCWKSQNLVCTY